MTRLLRPILLVSIFVLAMTGLARAETATIGIHFITPQEAADLARTHLSPKGRVVMVASRRMIVVDDDHKHVTAIRALLKRMDMAPQTLQVQLQMDAAEQDDMTSLIARGARLPGGWLRLHLGRTTIDTDQEGSYMLRMIPGRGGRIETGTIQPNRPEIVQWLSDHGIPRSESVEMVPITSGFNIEAHVNGKSVYLRLHPWIRRQQTQAGLEGQTQVLIGLGTAGNPQTPPSSTSPTMRVYGQPVISTDIHQIAISEADTELDIPLGQWVTIGAIHAPAATLGQAILSNEQNGTMKDVLIRLRIDAVR